MRLEVIQIMSNLKDEEIIKAFVHCKSSDNLSACYKCPVLKYDLCSNKLIKVSAGVIEKILEIVNRYKDEIKELKETIKIYRTYNKAIKFEREKAVKEIAERWKDIYESDKRYDRPNAHTLIYKLFDNIDKIANELTEGINE